jgi:ATP-binding cassette subfamily B protein
MTVPGYHFPVNLIGLVRELFSGIGRRRRLQLVGLFVLSIASSASEVITLGAVVPLIGILTDPAGVTSRPAVAWLARTLGLSPGADLVMPIMLAFTAAAIVAGTLRIMMLWVSIQISNAIGSDFSVETYRRTLYQPYQVHVSRNSSAVISGITAKVDTATGVVLALTTVVLSGMQLVAILVALIMIDPGIAAVAIAVFGSAYVLTAWSARRRLRRNSFSIAHEQSTVIKSLQEGLGAIRDVLLDGTQDVYGRAYATAIRKLRRASSENTFINQAPRYAMETLAMVLVAVLAFSISRRASVGAALPVLGALGLGAQRLLPMLQQVYGNWAVLASSQGALVDVVALLKQPLPDDARLPAPPPMDFRESIVFDGMTFRYGTESPIVLDGLNLTIARGSRVGIVGSTGSGKSTALDLLMALLEPTSGRILVDGVAIDPSTRRAWQRTIAHVPQAIFLSDSTIAENIAFGVPADQIDRDRVRTAAARAQLAEFIESRADGYDTIVGERGMQLSGGQRQRVGIARALYKQATVLVFDEATSALDGTTEGAVMEAIDGLDRELTIVMVAHRLTTLRNCGLIVELEHGRVASQGTYQSFQQPRTQLAGMRV